MAGVSNLPKKLQNREERKLHFFLYKNQLYKNKEAQNDPKIFKNKLRTTPASKSVNILRTSASGRYASLTGPASMSEWRPWRRSTTNFLIKNSCIGLKGS